jgi:chromosomal replication initiation ATPase DnaA
MSSPGAASSIGPKSEPMQLALALDHAESLAREDFLAGPSNAAALSLIERWPDWPSRTMLLRGPEGSGKSHLAAIWARASGARMLSPRSLEGADVPIALATGALVLENLAEGRFDEAALFHLLNLAREERAYVLITARSAPSTWRIAVPDLASRLRALPVVALTAPDDALLRAVIVKLFADRQLAVDESLVAYLATRIERTFAAARAAVDALDREALRLKRPVTRALAAELFREP